MTLIRHLILALALMAGFSPAFAQAPPVPALPDTERRTTYSITGATCACAVNFALYGDSTDYQDWVEVFLNGVRVNYNDATFGWTITSPTGSLATIPRPITDAVLTFNSVQTGTVQIVGARRPRRTSQFSESRGVAARDLNQALTDVIAQNRETWDKINDVTGRALISQPGNTIGPLPVPSGCKSAYLGFDSTGLNPTCIGIGSGTGNIVGPSPTVAGNIPLWNSTNGTLLSAGLGLGAGLTTSSSNLVINQAFTPTWTGLHLFNGGFVGNASANVQASTYGYFDSNPLAQEVLGTTGVRSTGAETNLVLHMASSLGSGTGVGAFKANLLTDSVANSGSAPIWSQASVVTLNSGFTLSGIVYESDLNVNNQLYPNLPEVGPNAVNYLATGTHNASHFYGTAAFAAGSTGDNFPLWNYGLLLGNSGFTGFNTASIRDSSSSPTSLLISGSHTGFVISISNTHATAGDAGILLAMGSAAANDTSSGYMDFTNPANSIQRGTIVAADSGGVGHVAFNTSSDERLKRSIGPLDNAINRLMSIEVHKYVGAQYEGNTADSYAVGFFAQNLYKAYPWAVTPSSDPDFHKHPWSVDYGQVTPLLVAAAQEQQHEIEDLRSRVAAVERSGVRKGHHHYAH